MSKEFFVIEYLYRICLEIRLISLKLEQDFVQYKLQVFCMGGTSFTLFQPNFSCKATNLQLEIEIKRFGKGFFY